MYDDDEEIREMKLRTVLDSKAFRDRTHPNHNLAMAEFRRLHNVELPSDSKIIDAADDDWRLDELKQNPAFNDRSHPDHGEVMKQFRELNNI